MGDVAAATDLHVLNTGFGEAITHVLAWPSAARMRFLDHDGRADVIQAVAAWPGAHPLLTDICALFEHFGLRVAGQRPLTGVSAAPIALSLFDLVVPPRWHHGTPANIAAAFEAAYRYGFAIDDFATLIASANVAWREVMLVRCASRFLCQAGLGLSPSYVLTTLNDNPEFVTALIAYFKARFDPDIDNRESVVSAALVELSLPIEATSTVDEDRILRAFAAFVSATLRTNWFQHGSDGAPKQYASFMLDSNRLEPRGSVVPYREIFVDCEDVEGIHMRSGPIARGGLRFSDRPEDFRTEVLGLMKTQTVKNSPIVPVGAKGAFVRKNPAITAEKAYRTFIAGLLDVTDNVVDASVITPDRTVVYGGDDPYLVVAADKGTARFSDIANEIALQRGFWLGDAFASGGSAGYDHKKMGITARGAWVSVRQHFADLGIDVDTDQIRVVGIGDMSGDVFGNGMLLSRGVQLVAAFDHRHIFVDPDPEPTTSYAERLRLAQLPASSWADYDATKISMGGGVWPRSAKRIMLPAAARAALAIATETVTPNDLIRAILAADVDLLWNGGIGTYVKSGREGHAEAADPTNDAIRIDANELGAKVVGEGGNLGLTQRARIEYALNGGRINADFIDNAAGVATSDREVNLKIALDIAQRAKLITDTERNDLLRQSLDEVAAAVLDSCQNQVLAISLAEAQAPQLLNRHERLIDDLERASGINRASETLPSRTELVSRTRAGLGLARPEIAVLLAHSKNVVRDELLASPVPDDAIFGASLLSYFPSRFRNRLSAEIAQHPLARDIIATELADDLINHVGPGLIYQLNERLGVPTSAVAAAYAVVRHLFPIDEMWQQARGQSELTPPQRWRALHGVQQFIEYTAARLLRHHGGQLDIAAMIRLYHSDISALQVAAPDVDPHREGLRLEAFDLSQTATRLQVDVCDVASIHTAIDDTLDLAWIVEGLSAHSTSNWWDAMAAAAVRDELADRHHRLAAAVVRLGGNCATTMSAWQHDAAPAIARFTRLRAELGRDNLIDVARAATVNAELLLLCRHAESLLR
ncbi:NAD-glutamate dehydrogenase domain-containing protein [Mycolicibacterium sphagni]|uniref:NAD-glutamate dehydrogenase n=1 Tax=Mycolicibacterium sphagni TaxID=1786 RepID=A0ABX2JYC8_9MYCO|nr:NAD-glutamate dehydrogenase domain-containing protein [Mycolicibacterium sphagni]NTY60452.1 NAD-glutamate dehydrogenase [Mycolicibacterium sphagni]